MEAGKVGGRSTLQGRGGEAKWGSGKVVKWRSEKRAFGDDHTPRGASRARCYFD
jgi:hypothetical protein